MGANGFLNQPPPGYSGSIWCLEACLAVSINKGPLFGAFITKCTLGSISGPVPPIWAFGELAL